MGTELVGTKRDREIATAVDVAAIPQTILTLVGTGQTWGVAETPVRLLGFGLVNDETLKLRLPAASKERWERAAEERGVSTSEFIRGLVDAYLDYQETHGRVVSRSVPAEDPAD